MPAEKIAKTILNKSRRRDAWFLDDYTINPYSGCSFNCLYCYIRGSKYGIHMEERLAIKTNAPELLERQLYNRAKKGQHGIIVLSSATDPYLQFEKEYRLTRKMLEIILKYRFPVHIITKSDLVTRDFDLLHEIDKTAILPADLQNKTQHKTFITFSFSTLEERVARIFEPGATIPQERLRTMQAAIKEGFYSGVSMMPLLPYITDTDEILEIMFKTFKESGAHYIFPASITLFGTEAGDSKTLVLNAIKKYYPNLIDKYHNLFKDSFQTAYAYRSELDKKIKALVTKHNIKTSIL